MKKEATEKTEEAAEEQKATKEKEKVTEQAKKEKPSKEKKTEKKTEEAKGPKRPKTMQCKVTLLDDTLFECELDVRETAYYIHLCLYIALPVSTVIQTDDTCYVHTNRNMLKVRSF